jgi:hypothetical protein
MGNRGLPKWGEPSTRDASAYAGIGGTTMRALDMGCVIALFVACTVDDGDNDPFGSGTVSPTTTTINPTTTVDPSTGESSGSTGGSTGDDDSTGPVTTTMTSGSTGVDSLDSSGGGSSEDTNDPTGNGMQPMDGMYSHCLTAEECDVSPVLCITIQDADMNNIDGFCSETGCANPAVDCAAAPGGTAVPRCMPATVNGMAMQACALDCSNAMTCPPPMQCYNLNGVGEICG